MNSFYLKVLEADSPFYEGECVSLVLPTIDGQYGIMAHHKNMIAAVSTGEMKLTLPTGEKIIAAVSEGMVKIYDNQVLVLVETAERPEEIDIRRAEIEAAEAKEQMLQKQSYQQYLLAQDKITRNLNRIKIKNKI